MSGRRGKFPTPCQKWVSCGAGVEKVEIIVKLKYEERAAVVNLWQAFFCRFCMKDLTKKINFVLNFYTKFGRLS